MLCPLHTILWSVIPFGFILWRRKARRRLRVLLFGSSFNPPTLSGHVALVQHYAHLYDEIWTLPVYQHAYQQKRNMVDYKHRLAMARLAFDEVRVGGKAVRVVEVEKEVCLQRHESIGTVHIIQELQYVSCIYLI